MEIDVILYGVSRDIIGANKYKIKVDIQMSVEGLLRKLENEYPKFKQLTSLFVAVNDEYVTKDYLIQKHDEVVLIPPVCGG